MISALCGFLGFSLALNVSLGLFLLFIFKNRSLTEKIYDTFDNNVEDIKNANDPWRNMGK